MAEISYACDVVQGFNFQKDVQTVVGHINSMKISDKDDLKSDLNVTDPENVADVVKVFGIVSDIYWAGGYADPLQLSCQVSTDNKNVLATLQHKSMANTEVELVFTIYDYDPKEKKYFKCFHTNGEKLLGLIFKSGGELAMNIEMDQSMEIVSPRNYSFQLGTMPQDKDQQIHLAVSLSGKFVKKWGVEISS